MQVSNHIGPRDPLVLPLEERLAVVNMYEELASCRAMAALVGCVSSIH